MTAAAGQRLAGADRAQTPRRAPDAATPPARPRRAAGGEQCGSQRPCKLAAATGSADCRRPALRSLLWSRGGRPGQRSSQQR